MIRCRATKFGQSEDDIKPGSGPITVNKVESARDIEGAFYTF